MLVASACGGEPADADKPEVVIGVLGDFSADDPVLPLRVLRGVDLAIDDYNGDTASRFTARVASFDTLGNAEGAIAAAEAAAENELLVGVIGPLAIEEILAAGDVFHEAQLPFLIPNTTDVSIPNEGWQGFRRLVSNLAGEGQALADAAATMGDRGPVSLLAAGPGRPSILMESARTFLEDAGVEIQRADLLDNIAEASKAVSKSAAVIYFGPADVGGKFAKALGEAGFEGAFLASSEARQSAFAEQAGEHAEGAITECVCASPDDPRLARFVEVFRSEFDVAPGEFAAESYEGALMILEAIEEVGTRAGRTVEFFASAREFRGETKTYRFNTVGDVGSAVVTLWSYEGGKWTFSGRSELQPGV
jgi:branched-chain amino acid transport system substrate-binding protein